jgi:hypothetical protein
MTAVLPLAPLRAQTPAPETKRPSVVAFAVRASLYHVQPTADQQAKIKTIVAEQQPRLAVVRDSVRPWLAKLRAARQQNDTAGARVARVAIRRGRFAVASIARQTLLNVRPLLTTPQQTQFDANLRRVKPALIRFVRGGRRSG